MISKILSIVAWAADNSKKISEWFGKRGRRSKEKKVEKTVHSHDERGVTDIVRNIKKRRKFRRDAS